MSSHIIEIGKFFIAVIPCIWYLRKELSEMKSKIDILETKIDGKFALIDKDLKAIERDVIYREERILSSIKH